jgi:hypothetical protein
MKKIMFLWIGLLLLSSVYALDSLGTFKQDEAVRVTQVCSDATYINISSIAYPNGNTAESGIEMISAGSGEFYYWFNDTSNLGRYQVRGISDGCTNQFAFYFDVTPTGSLQTTSQGIGSAMFLILILSLTGLFGWMGFKLTESKNLWVLGIFFLFLSIIMVVYNVWLGYEFHRNLTGFTDSSMPEIIFYIFLLLLVLGLLSSVALLFTRWKEVFKYIKKEIKRKDEDVDLDFDDDENWK